MASGGFDWAAQVRTAEWLARHPGPVVLTNQATDRIVELYDGLGFSLSFLEAPRMISCTGERRPAREVLATRHGPMSGTRVLLGSDNLLASEQLSGRRVGLVCNPASVNADFQHTLDQVAASGATLAAIFGPQHGFDAGVQDNMIETPHGRHLKYGVPVYSLYSDTREPTTEMLADLELLVIDPSRRRDARLHLRLYDGQLPPRRAETGPSRRRV